MTNDARQPEDAAAEPAEDGAPPQSPGRQEASEATRSGAEPVQIGYAEYEELKTLARERDQYLKRLQRSVADYQNLQKRIERFREMARLDLLRSLTEAILPVADSLTRALEAAEEAEGGEEMLEGLRLVEKEFYAALQKLDIHPIQAVGQQFDPHYHEAVMQEPTDQVPPRTVLRELKKGFTLGDQVARPSQVVVAGEAPQQADR
jgi:molecular chaperone GrpE